MTTFPTPVPDPQPATPGGLIALRFELEGIFDRLARREGNVTLDGKTGIGRCIVSVKGGGQINPAMVRDLAGTITNHKAEMGVLITMDKATTGMVDAANHGGSYTWPVNGGVFPRVQIITVDQLLKGDQPKLPPALTPYVKAPRHTVRPDQLSLGD